MGASRDSKRIPITGGRQRDERDEVLPQATKQFCFRLPRVRQANCDRHAEARHQLFEQAKEVRVRSESRLGSELVLSEPGIVRAVTILEHDDVFCARRKRGGSR